MSRLAPIPRPVIDPATGKAYSGGLIYTYQAGTSTPKATYPTRADADALTNANANPVVTNVKGYPTTEVWLLNDTAYKITIKTSDAATTIWESDTITGVFDNRFADAESINDTSGNELIKFVKTGSAVNEFSLANAATGAGPVLSATGNNTNIDINITPKGSGVINLNGTVSFTSATSVVINDSRTTTVVTALTLTGTTSGSAAAGIGTGLLFRAESADETPADIGAINFSLLDVTSGSEDSALDIQLRTAGGALYNAYRFINTGTSSFKYILTGSPTADRTLTLPDADASFGSVATQAEMEAASSTTANVTPGRLQYGPMVAKGWVMIDGASGTPVATVSHNVTSMTDNGVGDYTINWGTDFSSANFCNVGINTGAGSGNAAVILELVSQAAGTTRIFSKQGTAGIDRNGIGVAAFGDQA